MFLQPVAHGIDMTEEDQMMRAIAMSLGENVVMSTDQVCQPSHASGYSNKIAIFVS